jgi:hypothetical protein
VSVPVSVENDAFSVSLGLNGVQRVMLEIARLTLIGPGWRMSHDS